METEDCVRGSMGAQGPWGRSQAGVCFKRPPIPCCLHYRVPSPTGSKHLRHPNRISAALWTPTAPGREQTLHPTLLLLGASGHSHEVQDPVSWPLGPQAALLPCLMARGLAEGGTFRSKNQETMEQQAPVLVAAIASLQALKPLPSIDSRALTPSAPSPHPFSSGQSQRGAQSWQQGCVPRHPSSRPAPALRRTKGSHKDTVLY